MPMRKRSYKKRPSYRRKRNGLKKKVDRLYKNIETKHSSISIGGNIDDTGSFYLLNGIAIGTGVTDRIGNKITMVHFTAQFNSAWQSADAYNTMRFILFVDTQANTDPPSEVDLLQTPGTAYNSPFDYNFRKRFKILADRKYFMSENTPNVGGKITKRMNVNTEYVASGGTVTSISRGALWLYVVSDSGGIPHPAFNFQGRLLYQDS